MTNTKILVFQVVWLIEASHVKKLTTINLMVLG